MNHPSLREEKKLWRQGYSRVAGLDEAGRGPLAGPVVAAALVIRRGDAQREESGGQANTELGIRMNGLIRDSKKLSRARREKAYDALVTHPRICWGTGIVSERIIDRVNILQATKLAMARAVRNLQKKLAGPVEALLLDGNFTIDVPIFQRAYTGGDALIFSCAAASIIAKVTRDRLMDACHAQYPQYGFDKHRGYDTPFHEAMLARFGPCPIHRKTFAPVMRLLQDGKISGIVGKH